MDFDDPGFRELIDALHDGVYITDADGITLKVNSAYERLTGLRAEDVVGLTFGRARGGNAESIQDLQDHVHLRSEVVWHLLDIRLSIGIFLEDAVGLVRRDEVDTPLWAPVVVAAHHQPRRLLPCDQRGDGVQKTAHRVDGPPVGRGDR